MKVILALGLLSAYIAVSSSARVVCYFASWAIYRPGNNKFQASDVDPTLCTHILYAFVGLNETDGSLTILDDWEATGLQEIAHLMSLKQKNPNLKVILSMGGWSEGSEKYSHVAADPSLRANMVKTTMDYINEFSFDGFDLDWEFPNQRGGKEADKDNFVTWLSELKSALNAQGKSLSVAVGATIKSIETSYHLKAVSNNVDMINVMTYNFHGSFDDVVGHVAPLYASHLDISPEQKTFNVNASIHHWIDSGADKSKLNLGIRAFAECFILADPSNDGLYAPSAGSCSPASLNYAEICDIVRSSKSVWDDEQKVPHLVTGEKWISYENRASIKLKIDKIKELGLGGAMIWSMDGDDFRGLCGEEVYPLLRTIKENLL